MKAFFEEHAAFMVVLALLLTFIGGVFKLTYDADIQNQLDEQNRVRFSILDRCVPNGYVSHGSSPIRTYRCDSGVYTWEDMK